MYDYLVVYDKLTNNFVSSFVITFLSNHVNAGQFFLSHDDVGLSMSVTQGDAPTLGAITRRTFPRRPPRQPTRQSSARRRVTVQYASPVLEWEQDWWRLERNGDTYQSGNWTGDYS